MVAFGPAGLQNLLYSIKNKMDFFFNPTKKVIATIVEHDKIETFGPVPSKDMETLPPPSEVAILT